MTLKSNYMIFEGHGKQDVESGTASIIKSCFALYCEGWDSINPATKWPARCFIVGGVTRRSIVNVKFCDEFQVSRVFATCVGRTQT